MHLRSLALYNFRIYEQAYFEFSPKLNVIRGPNAIGKTSILEAIYFLMTGRSFRTAQASDLIRRDASFFCIEACFVKYDLEHYLKITYNGKDRKIVYNSTTYTSSTSLLGLLQGVVIHPDDLAIVKGSPSVRRQFLDIKLAQSDPLYVHHLTRYDRAMRQRNFLLKARSVGAIESWEHEMANSADYIIHQRVKATADLQERGGSFYNHLSSGKDQLSLTYKANGIGSVNVSDGGSLRQLFCDQYRRHRQREMDLGSTLTGPHKDDMMIFLDSKDARSFASEGQQRSCVVALRMAEWESLKAISYESPIMLIDDLGVSLDRSRRASLVAHFASLEQVFVTTTEEQILGNEEYVVTL